MAVVATRNRDEIPAPRDGSGVGERRGRGRPDDAGRFHSGSLCGLRSRRDDDPCGLRSGSGPRGRFRISRGREAEAYGQQQDGSDRQGAGRARDTGNLRQGLTFGGHVDSPHSVDDCDLHDLTRKAATIWLNKFRPKAARIGSRAVGRRGGARRRPWLHG